MEDKTEEMAMLAFQGSHSKHVLKKVLKKGSALPPPGRNNLIKVEMENYSVHVSRTGYTGEPVGFELFIPAERAEEIWNKILSAGRDKGIVPVGLGARDTLRLEAGMPLYGNEIGMDAEGKEIPIFAIPQAKHSVSFSPVKGDFVGREALKEQYEELRLEKEAKLVPRIIHPMVITGEGIARQGYEILVDDKKIGSITSGSVAPYWKFDSDGIEQRITEESGMRSVCFGYVNRDIEEYREVTISGRNRLLKARIVGHNLGSAAPPYARPIFVDRTLAKKSERMERPSSPTSEKAVEVIGGLVKKAIDNTMWRQKHCINLIPSEQTPSPLVRLLTIADPEGRYAEHKIVRALGEREVYYYQGTKFIEEIESELIKQMRIFLDCAQVETRAISGQMANTAVYSGLVRHLNRMERKSEPARLRSVMNNHILNGGHLSAQPMGALRDYIAVDPRTDKSAVVNFPVMEDNPYRIDVQKTAELMEEHEPLLIILGKSMILHPEPVSEIRKFADRLPEKPVILYDMAHVLGLVGEHFQRPFDEGADIVTGSTHKTFFGPQRGIIAADMDEFSEDYLLWETIVKRTFPGSVSNHHLGTQLGLLMACYEMNAFGMEYQKQVIANAKAFALALKENGLQVEGDPAVDYTETHQVLVRVGYAKGVEAAHRLEKNNIIVNYQGAPDDEGFTSSSCLRLGVQEMTRFGMKENDFNEVASLIADAVLKGNDISEKASSLRKKFTQMQYCLPRDVQEKLMNDLVENIL
jgi:aminomethyltransferase